MDTFRPPGDESEYENVSRGRLPTPAVTKALVDEAHTRYRSADDGAISTVYPALARVPRDLFGVCVVGTSGNIYAAGDADYEFTIMSASKPFVFALVCQALGADGAHAKLGVNNTGLPFNSLSAIENSPDGRTNPMVNPGAIATTSLVPGTTEQGRWRFIQDGLRSLRAERYP
jgi:glutaminase